LTKNTDHEIKRSGSAKSHIRRTENLTEPARIFSLNDSKLLTGLSFGAFIALILGGIVGSLTMDVEPGEYVAFAFSLVCFGAAPWVIARTGSPAAGATVLLVGALGPVFVPAYYQEGIRSPYLLWFVVVPMLAPLFLGVRFAVLSLVIGIIGFTVLYLRQWIDPGVPGETVPAFFFYFNLVLAAVFGTAVGVATRRSNLRIRRDLEDLEREIETKISDVEEMSALRTAVLDTSQSGIISCDAAGMVTDFNPAAESLFGFSRSEAMGQPVKTLIIPAGMVPKHEAGFSRYLETGKARILGKPLELVGLRADGTEIPIEVLVQRIDLPGPPQFTAFLRDLRAQRESEAMLRRREAQLQKARRLEDVGRLAAGVAHDFNNLLTIVSGYSESIAGHAEAGSTIREDAFEIASAAERAAVITNQLLAFSRSQVLQLGPLDLSRLLREFETTLRSIVPPLVDLRLEVPDAPWLVSADTSQLERVLMNIVLNACDAIEGEGRLVVSLRYVESEEAVVQESDGSAPGRHVELTCRDEGVGMDDDTLSHAFEPFFTTKGVGKGTGLGLATVYGIVQQSGGSVSIESEVGQGSTVRILLPEAKIDEIPSRGGARSGDPSAATIVVVDDESSVRNVIAKRLRIDSYRVLEAADGEEAMNIMNREGDVVDLVISDLIMPIKSGAELVSEISKDYPSVKFIIMSGYLSDDAKQIDSGSQQTVFLQKPVRMGKLARTVELLLRRSEADSAKSG